MKRTLAIVEREMRRFRRSPFLIVMSMIFPLAQLVVLHDRQLGRTVRGEGPVRERSLAELMALDAGAWFDARWAGAGVPSLEQVVELTRGRAALNVEIKSPPSDWEGTAEALLALLTGHGRLPTTIVSGFEPGALQAVRTRSVAMSCGSVAPNQSS